MAKKMYYTEQEAADKLGISPEGLARYVRDDKLRVFQDGSQKMFKVEEVDALAAPAAPAEGPEEIELTPADSVAEAPTLAQADQTAPPSGKEDTVITAEGISIFDDEDLEIEAADPMAKTQIAPSLEEQMSLDGAGSGSGLLDLTRESDDTSLGAEVLDHIDMEEAIGSDILPAQEAPPPAGAPVEAAAPVAAEAIDPNAGLFSGIVVGCAVASGLLVVVMMAAMFRMLPAFVEAMKNRMAVVAGAVVAVVVIAAVVGLLIGKALYGREMVVQRGAA